MLKMSKPIGKEKAGTYFKSEFGAADQSNYYRNGQQLAGPEEKASVLVGEWHGRLAERFGLSGGVDELHYDRLVQGQDPNTGAQLIKHRPVVHVEEWIKSGSAWRKHVEEMVLELADRPRDLLRVVPPSERRRNAPTPERPAAVVVPEKLNPRQEKLVEMHVIAAGVFRGNMVAGGAGRNYLEGRGVTAESIAKFGLGYSVSGDQLRGKLESYGPELMEASGLFWRDKQGVLHDRFRDRVMFPIHNRSGQIVAFAGRRIDGREEGKYVNTRETEIYKKSEVLYNFHRADAVGTGRVVVVEGYLDVIAADQAGVSDVVALSGKSISDVQAQALRSIASDVVQNLDGGPEELTKGQQSQADQLPTLMKAGLRVRSLDMPGDPDTFIKTNGPEAYRAELDDAKPLVEWLAEHAREVHGLDKPEVYPGENIDKITNALKMVMGQLEQIPEEQREQISAELRRHLGVKVEDVPEVKKNHSEHIAAWDLTFAPDKSYSVSALVGGDAGLVADHKAAVRVAMDAGEEYAMARMGGDNAPVTSSNWCAALFLHDTARPVDGGAPNPHLHTHAVAMNMTQGPDKIRSMTAKEIFRIQSFESAVYQSEIAHRAMSRGYELQHGKNFSTRIQGYSPEYLLAMSARSESINKEKAEKGLVGAEADERVNKRLREAKQAWVPEDLKAEHRRQAAEMGQDPASVVAAAKERKARVVMLSDQQRVKLADEAVLYARDRLQANQAVNDQFEILRDALRFGLGRLRLPDVKAALGREIAKGEFVEVQHYRQGAPGARYTTESMRELERETIQMVLAGQGKTEPIAPNLTKYQFRDRYKYFMVNGERKEMNNKQLHMGYNVLTSPHQYMIVLGAAGVGKTRALTPIAELAEYKNVLREIFHQHGRSGYEVHGLAAASKAADNLRGLGIKSETLQAHNYRGVDPKVGKRLYILDEGSLVGAQDFRKFVGLVRPIDRVVIAGDLRQHQSVQAGRILEELHQAGVATFQIDKIIRQEEAPELLRVIEKLKVGKHIEGLTDLKEQGRMHQVADRNKRLEYMAIWYLRDPEHTIMVAPDNRTIGELNAAARIQLRLAGKLGPDVYEGKILTGVRDVREADRKRAVYYEPGNVVRWGKAVGSLGVQSGDYTPVVRVDANKNHVTIQVGSREVTYNPRNAYGVEIYETRDRKFAAGDRIQVTRPWRVSKDLRIANRSMGSIREIDAKGNATLEMDNGERVSVDMRKMRHLDHAYALTSYSLQYATSKRALLHLDVGDSRIRTLMDKALVYVGLSRGSHDMQVFTDDEKVLLSPESPILKENLKPKALSAREIQSIGIAS